MIGKTLTASGGTLTLGYEDETDGYGDNGYWSHDDGTQGQCAAVGEAFLTLAITRPAMPATTHVNLDGIEVTQVVQDMNQVVPLVAGKDTWVRVYLSGNAAPSVSLRGQLSAQSAGAGTVILSSANSSKLSGDGLNARRTRWDGSLNFLLPASLTLPGTLTLTVASVDMLDFSDLNSVKVVPLVCNQCSAMQVTFSRSPILRTRIFSVSYVAKVGGAMTPTTFVPQVADITLLQSWLPRAYPTAGWNPAP